MTEETEVTEATLLATKEASWPDDSPHRLEENVMTVVCGNTHLHWAVHMGKRNKFTPILFWRTPPIHKEEQKDDPCTVLGRHLPKQAHTVIFGSETVTHKKEAASEASAQRRIPVLSVYIISTNDEHEAGIQFLFKDVPARVFKLSAHHFFKQEEGAYEGIGVDRVAALFACKASYPRRPCLVFDAGTAWTYSAIDHKGHILGGGISPGVGARFRSLSDYCGNLPVIEHEIYHDVLRKNLEKNQAFPLFATDTQTAMMTSVFSEIANQCRYLVKKFLERVKADYGDGTEGKPVVSITGGDAPFLQKVLQGDFSGVIESEPGAHMPIDEFALEEAKHLVHYGIGHLLDTNMAPEPSNPDDVLRELLYGTRIAKKFPLVLSLGGDDVFRGSIMGIKPGKTVEEDVFEVRYDDGDSEQLDLIEIYDAFKLYVDVGETGNGDKLKIDQLNKSVTQMDEKFPKLKDGAPQRVAAQEEEVKRKQEAEAKRRQAQSPKRSRAPSKTPAPKKTRRSKEATDTNKKTMYIKKRIAKAFEGTNGESEIYFGTIARITNTKEPYYWHITYDDDDEEEFDEKDIAAALKLYQVHRADDPKTKEMIQVHVAKASLKPPPAPNKDSMDVDVVAPVTSVSEVTHAEAPPAASIQTAAS